MKIAILANGFHLDSNKLICEFFKRIQNKTKILTENVYDLDDAYKRFSGVLAINQNPKTLVGVYKTAKVNSRITKYRSSESFQPICDLVREIGKPFDYGSLNFQYTIKGRVCTETLSATDLEIEKIIRTAFEHASEKNLPLINADLSCSLNTELFWRKCVSEVRADYPDVIFYEMFFGESLSFIKKTAPCVVLCSKLCAEAFETYMSGDLSSSYTLDDPSFGIFECNFTLPSEKQNEIYFTISSCIDVVKELGRKDDLAGELQKKLESLYSQNLDEDTLLENLFS